MIQQGAMRALVRGGGVRIKTGSKRNQYVTSYVAGAPSIPYSMLRTAPRVFTMCMPMLLATACECNHVV